jgi:polysaccharide chain length determinant protein (PEP-CTERM system associated)
LALAWFIAVGGWFAVQQMPDRYKVEARVYLDTESVLTPLLAGISVQSNLNQVAAIVSETLLVYSNLIEVVRIAEREGGLEFSGNRELLIEKLARNISIRSGGKKNMYTISFVDEDPRTAKVIVDSLLKVFVERSLKDNLDDAKSAQQFIDQQLDAYRTKLEAAERAVTQFRRDNWAVLPGAGAKYFDRLVELKEASRKAELELREAEDSAASIRQKLAIASRNAALPKEEKATEAGESKTETEIRISVLQQRLDELRLQYTDEHPDVVAAEGMMRELRRRKEAEDAAKRVKEQREAAARLTEGSSEGAIAQAADPVVQELTVKLAAVEATIAAKKARLADHTKRYYELQAMVDAVPQVEAEYTQLTRDYEVTRARYDELLKRRETASISEEMESGNATGGFRIVAPPRLPREPSEPDRLLLMTMVFLAALSGGFGFSWFIGQLKPSIYDEPKLAELGAGIPVLGTVVMAWTDKQKRRRNWGRFAFLTSCASLLSAYVAVILMLLSAVSRA